MSKIISLLSCIIMGNVIVFAGFGYCYACYQIVISPQWYLIFAVLVPSIPMFMGLYWCIKWAVKKVFAAVR